MILDLYKMDSCPYCRMVMDHIASSGRTDVEYHDIRKNAADRQYLISEGGKEQVPCLFIDGKALYESSDIITWLKNHPEQSEESH